MKARGVDRESYPLFLDRAEEFLAAAHGSFARGHFQAATSNAVHAAIAAMDAITVFHAGKRSASDRHEEVLVLVRSLRLPDHDLSKRLVQLGRLLGMKTRAEYADARIKRGEAEDAVRTAERIVTWARGHLPRTEQPRP